MERKHATEGPLATDAPISASAHAASVQRAPAASDDAPAARGGAVEIAADRRDHSRPPQFGAEVDIQLRTLLAHVDRNLELYRAASTQPDRDGALEAIDVRVAVALRHVPATLHEQFRAELRALLGRRGFEQLERALAEGEGSYGARAAASLGVDRARVRARGPIQLDADGDTPELAAENAHAIAEHGLGGGGGTLPFLDEIQRSFGQHDVGGVQAHVGGAARDAASALGARAYASGDAVAFAAAPDLHLAAHEAAHVVQQRGGVRLSGGVGAAGDAYERHADAVADLVVRGESAQALLDQHAHRGAAGGSAVQRVAEPRAQVRDAIAAIATAEALDPVIAQLSTLPRRPLTREHTLTIGTTAHVIRGADIGYLLAQAQDHRGAIGGHAADPRASSRATLTAAVGRATDLADLEGTRSSIQAIGATPPGGLVAIAIARSSYSVDVTDLDWLLLTVQTRIAAIQHVAVVDPTMTAPPLASEAVPTSTHGVEVPAVGGDPEELGTPDVAWQSVMQFPMDIELQVPPAGSVRFQLQVEVQAHRFSTAEEPGEEDITFELAGQLGSRRPDAGRSSRDRFAPQPARGIGLTARGGLRTIAEQAIGHRLALSGTDRIRVEERNGRVSGSIGWDFGAVDVGPMRVSFGFNVIQWDQGRDFSLLSSQLSITTPWQALHDPTDSRVRAVGRVTFSPNRVMLARAVSGVALRLLGTSAVAEESVGAALGAAALVGMEMIGPIALVGVFAAATIGLALTGAVLWHEMMTDPPPARRYVGMSRPTTDPRMTAHGHELHDRVRAFCLAYSDTMRDSAPRSLGAGAAAGATAARDWIAQLEAQGVSVADIRAAAMSATDLDQHVLAAVRPGFETEVDTRTSQLVVASDLSQRREWATRYLRSCLTLDEAAPAAPEFQYDPCRDEAAPITDGFGDSVDAMGAPFDPSTCEPGESSADAPNPASGVEDPGYRHLGS